MADGDGEKVINIRNQATLSIIGTFVDAAVSFVGLILFANVLGASGLGQFYLLLAVVRVTQFPIGGIGNAVLKRGSERNNDPAAFFGGGIAFATGYAVAIGSILLALVTIAPGVIPYGMSIVVTAFALFVVEVFYYLTLNAYRSHGKTGYAGLTDNALGILETALQVVLLLAGFDVLGLLAGTAAMTALVAGALLAFSTVDVARPNEEVLASIWRYGRWSVLTSGLKNAYSRLPLLLVGAVLGEEVAGYYTSADRLLVLGSHVASSIAPALMVRASAAGAESASSLPDLRIALRYATVLAIPMLFGSLALSNALMVTVFGPTFVGTGPILVGLAVYHVVNTYDAVIFSFFEGINRPENATKATAVALTALAVGCAVAIFRVGLLGVVAAVVLAHAVRVLVGEGMLYAAFDRAVIPRGVGRQLVAGVLMWAVVAGLHRYVPITGWFRLFVVVGVGAAVYSVVLLALDEYLRGMVQSILHDAFELVGFGAQNT